MGREHSILKSFSYAYGGIKEALRQEPNLKIHAAIAAAAIVLATFLGFSRIEWMVLVFTITFVLVLELINTVVEEIIDMISPAVSERAKLVKDMMAAAVLLGAIFSIIAGLILFLPKVL